MTAPERCVTCGLAVPDWPAGWLRTDDGENYCPVHKGDRRFLDARRGEPRA